MTSTTRFALATFALLTLPLGCGGGSDQVDIGSNGSQLSDYAATWDGYAEAYQFDQGSDRIRLVIDANGTGTLEVGDAPLLPVPTDPDVGYPVDRDLLRDNVQFTAGFRYPVHDAHVESRRIRLSISANDLYDAWCAMQTPVLDDYNSTPDVHSYSCLPNWGYVVSAPQCTLLMPPNLEPGLSVDCGKLSLCTLAHACRCTESACAASPETAQAFIDAALETGSGGASLVGTLAIGNTTRVTVRMTQQ